MPILISVFPPSERGKVIGISAAATYLGLSLGPFIGGLITEHLGWPNIFWATVPLSAVVVVAGRALITAEGKSAHKEKFDKAGALLYGITLSMLIVGFSTLPSLSGAGALVIALLSLFFFIKWEMKFKSPLLDVELFARNAVFAFSNFAALVNYAATYAVSFLLSIYLQYVRDFSPQQTGLLLVVQPILMTLFSPAIGKLSDRVEPRFLATSGMGLIAAILFGFCFLTPATPLFVVAGALALLGFGFALFASPNTNAVMSSVDRKHYGVASGTLGAMRMTGQMLSMGLATMVFAIFHGARPLAAEPPDKVVTSIALIFGVSALLCVGGAFLSMRRGSVHSGKPESVTDKTRALTD
jgi:MFS family permease